MTLNTYHGTWTSSPGSRMSACGRLSTLTLSRGSRQLGDGSSLFWTTGRAWNSSEISRGDPVTMPLPRPESAPRFREQLQRVLDYLRTHYDRRLEYREENNFAFMALTFLSKQRTHAQTILTLQDSRDSLLIARSMLEGLMLLLWTE